MEKIILKNTLKDPFYFLDICSPSYFMRKKKISQNTQVQNEKYKKKNEQISVMRNQYNKQVKYGRKKEKIERDESVALWVPGK